MAEITVSEGVPIEIFVDAGADAIQVREPGATILTGTPVVTSNEVPEPFTPDASPWVVNGAVAMEHLRLVELTTPLSGALSGFGRFFVKQSDGQPYFLDSSGVESWLLGVPEPFTPTTDPWVVNGRISSPGAGSGSERFGANSLAGGANSSAFGNGASAGGDGSIVIGFGASTSVQDAICMGSSAIVNGATSMAIGANSVAGSATAIDCVAIGCEAIAVGTLSTAIGQGAEAVGIRGTAIGNDAEAEDESTTACGARSRARGFSATVLGQFARADFAFSMALGSTARTGGASSVAVGTSSQTDGVSSTAVGTSSGTGSSATGGVALGAFANATHDGAAAIGFGAVSTGVRRCTIGTIAGGADMELQMGMGIGVWGVSPPATQPLKINDPSGGAIVDTEARTAINAIIDVLEGAGLSASV